jgi:hypothetical protein
MFLPSGKLKAALKLLLAASIAVSTSGQFAQGSHCTDSASAGSPSPCSTNGCCCSQRGSEVRACCCCAKKAPTPQAPSSGVSKPHSDLKLALWGQPHLAVAALTASSAVPSATEDRFFSPPGPSVQLLLCIWRI